MNRRVLFAAPRGCCAGVDRAIATVEKALELHGPPIYVRHEIVHNTHVINTLKDKGAIFVEETHEVPEGSIVIFSAHGIAPAVRQEAAARRLRAIDATCPLVTKVHREAARYAEQDYDILLIGHQGHEEVIGTSGEAPDHIQLVDGPRDAANIQVRNPDKVVWLSQTTLSVDETTQTVTALKDRYPNLQSPLSDDICYATQNRQQAVKQLAADADLVLIVGSSNSSNSLRLVEVTRAAGARQAHLVDHADQIKAAWLTDVATIGVSSGASVPEILVLGVLTWLAKHGYSDVQTVTYTEEHQHFALPRELGAPADRGGVTLSASEAGTPAEMQPAPCERAVRFLDRSVEHGGVPSAQLSLDASFGDTFTGGQARAILRERFGTDPGFDLADEAFTAMVALMLLPPGGTAKEKELGLRLGRQIESARWQQRYRFFPGANGFPADTDCTGLAAAALHEHRLLSAGDLEAHAADLLRAAAPPPGCASPHNGLAEGALLHPQVLMTYWEDGLEPATLPRGRKHDAVACANALYTIQLGAGPLTADATSVVEATTRYLADHAESGRYLNGTRYYPSPDAFLYAVSRLCARFPQTTADLAGPVRRAFLRREATAPAQDLARAPDGSLDLALRTLTADLLALSAGQEQRRVLLTGAQRGDGSWPPCAYYRMGRFPVYFGSPYLTTVFALAALRTRKREDCR